MRVAPRACERRPSQACVSAGNTGALMGWRNYYFRFLEGIERSGVGDGITAYQQKRAKR